MSTVVAYSPNPGFEGAVAGVEFSAGQATVRRSNARALAYFRRHGYGLNQPVASAPEPPDPRDVGAGGDGIVAVGTRLRDAAVDPKPSDFLPPTNAGVDNPHGSRVVSPEIHGSSSRPVTEGEVPRSPAAQEAKETAAAAAAFNVESTSSAVTIAMPVETTAPDPETTSIAEPEVPAPAKASAAKKAPAKASAAKKAPATAKKAQK